MKSDGSPSAKPLWKQATLVLFHEQWVGTGWSILGRPDAL
jgi:hypothetical protein